MPLTQEEESELASLEAEFAPQEEIVGKGRIVGGGIMPLTQEEELELQQLEAEFAPQEEIVGKGRIVGGGGEFRGAGATGEFELRPSFLERATKKVAERAGVVGENIGGAFLGGADILEKQNILQEPDLFSEQAQENVEQTNRNRLRLTGAIAGGINDVVGEGIVSIYTGLVSPKIQGQLSEDFRELLDSDGGKAGLEVLKQGVEVYGRWKAQNPETAGDLEDVLNIASVATQFKGGQLLKQLRQTEKVLNDKIIRTVKDKLPRIVKQSGIKTSLKKFDDESIGGIIEITKNKNNLTFVDDLGDIVSEGAVPQNVPQFLQGIEQTKQSLFNQYDDILRSVTGKGAEIKTDTIADGLEALKTHIFIQRNPALLNRVNQQVKFWRDRKKMSLIEAEGELKRINANTFAVKNSSDPNIINSHSVDMVIGDRIRGSLTKSIGGSKGAEFQVLRKKYGAVRMLEDGVAKAAKANRVKSTRAFSDLSDVLTGGTAIYAWSNLNAPLIAATMGAKFIKVFSNWNRNTDTLTKRMFNVVDDSIKKGATIHK